MQGISTRHVHLPRDEDDAELLCSEVGAGPEAVILLHGLTGHRHDFQSVLPQLARGSPMRWLAPDLRGHGDFTHTGRSETFTFDQLVEDLVRLLEALGIERAHLLGHSFGGMVSLRFALSRPHQLRSLILMSTTPNAPEGYDEALFENAGAIARERGMGFLQQIVEKVSRREENPTPADRQTAKWADVYWPHQVLRYRAMDPVGYAALGHAMVQQRDLSEDLSRIQCPTTVLVGADDTRFLSGAETLAQGITNARKHVIPDAGHHPQMENTDAWLEAMRGHLQAIQEAPVR